MDVVILLFLLFGIVLIVARNSVADRMVEARVEDGVLRLVLRGPNRFWAGRREVEIPLRAVDDARTEPEPQTLASGMRLPGVWIPRVLLAGTYRKPTSRSFFAVAYGRDALVLDLDGHEYDMVVVDVDDPQRLMERIRDPGNP